MKVCDLPGTGFELHTSVFGCPFYIGKSGRALEVNKQFADYQDIQTVEAWQRLPENDCLRARGDIRYQAASAFAQRHPWPDTIPL